MSKFIESLSFEGDRVYRAGEVLFTTPIKEDNIQAIGMHVEGDRDPAVIYVGTGHCCFGQVYVLRLKDLPHVDRILTPDLIVADLYSLKTDCEKTHFGNEWSLLVTGYGCAGAGVRLLGPYYRNQIDLLGTEEYHSLFPSGQHSAPRFRLDRERRTLYLDVFKAGYRLKPGRRRPAGLPEILVSSETHEFAELPDLWTSVDLGPRLDAYGLRRADLIKDQFSRIR